jgi:ADP-ribose pyrophosphatase YjhB (NUDIX family)
MNKRARAVIIKNKKILLMGRIKNGHKYFVFPGGGVEKNENTKSALIREIKEEFNIEVKIEKLLFKIKNRGRLEFYFLIKNFRGIPEVSGEEKERMNKNNQYFPAWFDLKDVIKLPNLYLAKAKRKFEELIEKN